MSSLDEALEVRKQDSQIPILCTEIVDEEFLSKALEERITLTVDSISYLEAIGDSGHQRSSALEVRHMLIVRSADVIICIEDVLAIDR